jgi:hypothetical protein
LRGGRLAGQFADGQAVARGLGHDHQHRQGHARVIDSPVTFNNMVNAVLAELRD